ncbi:unnamed protein product [Bursaphelenchus okinawaensis]|uniref:Uncharacterized protein n=1 Tax=Bursaphelenchus okinawaensis TaxID=465554 RepID=A0A811JVG6_9BILA|nr:unnamed protein product [Bursaphelenchus okinawaensis]CAG9084432.1 unnamed protein product [Bursaphelenchus okinawaensis]
MTAAKKGERAGGLLLCSSPLMATDWKRKIWLSAGFAIFTGITLRFALFLQNPPSIYSHKPGKCKNIVGLEHGVLSMTESDVLNLVLVFSAQHKNIRAHVILLETKEKTNKLMNNISLHELNVNKWKNSERFNPISAHIHVEGSTSQNKYRAFVYVLSQEGDQTPVQVFELRLQKGVLTHLQTIHNQEFIGSTDISVLSPGRFILAKPHFFNNRYLQLLELLFYRGYGQLLIFNGKTVSTLERGLQGPTKMLWDPKTSRLYVGIKYSREIQAYTLKKDLTLKPLTSINLMSSPTYITNGENELWVGSSPGGHMFHDQSNTSHILRIRFQDDIAQTWVITESFASTQFKWSNINGLVVTNSGILIASPQTAAFCTVADMALV